jgi:hypothetical protein
LGKLHRLTHNCLFLPFVSRVGIAIREAEKCAASISAPSALILHLMAADGGQCGSSRFVRQATCLNFPGNNGLVASVPGMMDFD